ncbi:MAG: hypothetical protein PHU27_03800 [Salinivirgaceae bacterium]|nr:hypothetical protein [Salinivirgaceae bacterium]MDD4745691.1 hypothetical protein [Salinivirgaceae bacterium]MDY0279655.1 hypothetical protein [Salinivirgaceae bacterium]
MKLSYVLIDIALFLMFSLNINSIFGQSNFHLDSTYERYRERLREHFIVIDSCVEHQGVNIPATEINYSENRMEWSDGNSNMSHYLSILATEFAIQSNQQKPTLQTRSELLYALMALERLDLYSETFLRTNSNNESEYPVLIVNPRANINGFHNRDDVSSEFWKSHKHHFKTDSFRSVYTHANDPALSQDNIIHHLEGLTLVSVLVNKISIKDIPIHFDTPIIPNYLKNRGIWAGDSIDCKKWVADIAKRYVLLIQNKTKKRLPKPLLGVRTHWYIANPLNNELVEEGSGSDLDLSIFFHYGFIETARFLTGENHRRYHGLSPTHGMIFKTLMRYRQIKLPGFIPNIPIKFDDYKIRSLATTGNPMGNETFELLLHHRNHSAIFKYEHFPLIWLILHSKNATQHLLDVGIYEIEKSYYDTLFMDIPKNGSNDCNSKNWKSTSRCVWPEHLPKTSEIGHEYSGMDFMMLFNLYRLVFIVHKDNSN